MIGVEGGPDLDGGDGGVIMKAATIATAARMSPVNAIHRAGRPTSRRGRGAADALTVEAPHAARSEPTDAPGSRAAFPSPRARTHPGPPAAAQRTGEARAHPLQPLGLLPEAHPYFGKSLLRPLGQRDHRRLRPPSTAPHRHMHDEP
jgi:hypothetical protein